MKLDAAWMSVCPFSHRTGFMGAKIIENEMNPAMRPIFHHDFLQEIPAVFAGFPGRAPARGHSRMGAESSKELQRTVFPAVTAGSPGSQVTPTLAASGYGLQRPQFIEAHYRAIRWRVPIKANYGVFFTSKSGSVLRHQVWPVRNLKP